MFPKFSVAHNCRELEDKFANLAFNVYGSSLRTQNVNSCLFKFVGVLRLGLCIFYMRSYYLACNAAGKAALCDVRYI